MAGVPAFPVDPTGYAAQPSGAENLVNVVAFNQNSKRTSRATVPPTEQPVARSRKRTKAGVYTSDITWDDLQRHFHLPTSQACEQLGLGVTVLKRTARKFGLTRWPYKKPVKSQQQLLPFPDDAAAIAHHQFRPPRQQQQQQRPTSPFSLTSGNVVPAPRNPHARPPTFADSSTAAGSAAQWEAPPTPRGASRPVVRHVSDDPVALETMLASLGVLESPPQQAQQQELQTPSATRAPPAHAWSAGDGAADSIPPLSGGSFAMRDNPANDDSSQQQGFVFLPPGAAAAEDSLLRLIASAGKCSVGGEQAPDSTSTTALLHALLASPYVRDALVKHAAESLPERPLAAGSVG